MLSVKIPRLLSERVARVARSRNQTVSEVVRRALEQLEVEARPPRKGSALQRAGRLVGAVSGPGDLSTNPKYLEGYGR